MEEEDQRSRNQTLNSPSKTDLSQTNEKEVQQSKTSQQYTKVEREQTAFDPDLLDSDMYISEEQHVEFDNMIQQKRQEIEDTKQQFEKWLDALTRRRMFALSRLRKLGLQHKERLHLYGKVTDYVQQVEDSAKSSANVSRATSGLSANTDCMNSPASEKDNSARINSCMEREGTGFVLLNNSDSTNNNTQGLKNDPTNTIQIETPGIAPLKI